MNPDTEWFFEKPGPWQEAYRRLRSIVLDCHLQESLKWGCPCYTYNDKNVVLIHGFKKYCALLFHKGALLADPAGILIRQTANVQSARQVRFTQVADIERQAALLRQYIFEAVEAEKQGLKVATQETRAYILPEELQAMLEADLSLKTDFERLTPGRRRGYVLYFSSAKQAKTRMARIEKCLPRIREGKGLED